MPKFPEGLDDTVDLWFVRYYDPVRQVNVAGVVNKHPFQVVEESKDLKTFQRLTLYDAIEYVRSGKDTSGKVKEMIRWVDCCGFSLFEAQPGIWQQDFHGHRCKRWPKVKKRSLVGIDYRGGMHVEMYEDYEEHPYVRWGESEPAKPIKPAWEAHDPEPKKDVKDSHSKEEKGEESWIF